MAGWIDKVFELTPIEEHAGMYFKREDKFCPKGLFHINGSKFRQCLYLVDRWVREKGIKGVVSGSVSQSPQHVFISEICKHYGIGCVIVHSKKEPKKSSYLNVAIENGSKLVWNNVGYAQTLGSKAKQLLSKLPNHAYLETNITLDERFNSWDDIEKFHRIGAEQVKNIPSHIERLIIPCGSCNSVTSILYGLVLFPKPNIKEIVLMGIGNNGSNNIGYVETRLKHICKLKGIPIDDVFGFSFLSDDNARHKLEHVNLNGTGFCKYTDEMKEFAGQIEFHPRYEGKCIRYLKKNLKEYWNQKSLFWVVGSDMKFK